MVKTNDEQQVYVIPAGGGYSCLGYDVCLKRARKYAAWLRALGIRAYAPSKAKRGTIEAYQRYEQLVKRIKQLNHTRNIRCGEGLEPRLIGLEGCRIEVTTPEGDTRRFNVGMSTGWIPCHLEVANRASSGGGSAYIGPKDTIRKIERVREPVSNNVFTTELLKALAGQGVDMKQFKGR